MKKIFLVMLLSFLCFTQISANPKSTIYGIEDKKASLYDEFLNKERTLYIYKYNINVEELEIKWELYEDGIRVDCINKNSLMKDYQDGKGYRDGKGYLFLTLDQNGLKLHSNDLLVGTTTSIFPYNGKQFYNAYKHVTYVRKDKSSVSNKDSLIKAEWEENGHSYKMNIYVEFD